jgi:regulator of protease activity HflC (stomatin/prohibitin superfamily)
MFGIEGFMTAVLMAVGIAVVFVAMGVKAVPQGAEYTVERFGRYRRTLRPGLHVITPCGERIGARLGRMVISGFTLVVLVILGLALVTVFMGVKVVPQGREFTVERFGRYMRTLTPGLHIITPFVEAVGARLNMMEQVLDVPSQEVITKDNAMVRVDGVVFFQILDAAKAAYEVTNLQIAILNLTMTNLRTVMGSMDLDELLSQRDRINAQLLHVVDDATTPWGVKVTRIEIKDIEPPKDLVDSMARQMKAERDKRASILEAEGQRQAAILKAEGEKQGKILEAEGRKEAAFRDAEAREREAEAEAKATAMLSQALARGDRQAINYFVAQKYVEAFGKFATSPNQKVVFLPLEATSLLGTLGGIGEIAREAMGRPNGAANGGLHQ